MGGIGQNLQLQSDGSEIVCAIRAPHKTYACKILWQNISYFASYGEKLVCQTSGFMTLFFLSALACVILSLSHPEDCVPSVVDLLRKMKVVGSGHLDSRKIIVKKLIGRPHVPHMVRTYIWYVPHMVRTGIWYIPHMICTDIYIQWNLTAEGGGGHWGVHVAWKKDY